MTSFKSLETVTFFTMSFIVWELQSWISFKIVDGVITYETKDTGIENLLEKYIFNFDICVETTSLSFHLNATRASAERFLYHTIHLPRSEAADSEMHRGI